MVDPLEKIIKISKEQAEKLKKIRNIFELDEENEYETEMKRLKNKKIRVTYKETIFFNPSREKTDTQVQSQELEKYLQNIISSTMTQNEEVIKKADSASLIKFNVNIHNNFYNTSYNYHVSSEDQEISNKNNTNSIVNNLQRRENSIPIASRSAIKQEHFFVVFVPCMNCGLDIHLEETEKHSQFCSKVLDEVIKAETNIYTYHTIDYKLRKLLQHVASLKNSDVTCIISSNTPNEISKEIISVSSEVLQNLSATLAIEIINQDSIKKLKKIFFDLDNLSQHFTGSLPSLIIIDRAKVLVREKLKIFKNDYLVQVHTKKLNEKKTGSIYEELGNKSNQPLEKTVQVKNTYDSTNPMQDNPVDTSFSDSQVMSDGPEEQIQMIDSAQVTNTKKKLTEIHSDIEENSRKSELSDCTSITSNNATVKEEAIGDLQCLRTSSTGLQIKQEFIKLVWKVKFEKLYHSHEGQQIPGDALFEACLNEKIPKEKWLNFVIQELNQPIKYLGVKKSSKKNQITKSHFLKTSEMGVIDEE